MWQRFWSERKEKDSLEKLSEMTCKMSKMTETMSRKHNKMIVPQDLFDEAKVQQKRLSHIYGERF